MSYEDKFRVLGVWVYPCYSGLRSISLFFSFLHSPLSPLSLTLLSGLDHFLFVAQVCLFHKRKGTPGPDVTVEHGVMDRRHAFPLFLRIPVIPNLPPALLFSLSFSFICLPET